MKTGRVLHYEIVENIGKGGMGEVYRARDTRLGREVALKFVPAHVCADSAVRQRLLTEARTASRLVHPNIVGIHAIERSEDGEDFIVMEMVNGRPLSDLVREGPLPLERVVDIVCDIAGGLLAAHEQGIVHRDVKTENVMVTADGRVKVLDFGLARDHEATRLTREDVTVGTVRCMAPEQARGDAIDGRTDIWALGVCLYEMITGQSPFNGDQDQAVIYQIVNEHPKAVSELRPDVPWELELAVATALAKDPADRYQSAADFCAAMGSARLALERGVTTEAPVSTAATPSIAVLPFANMSTEPEQEFFCEGIAEDIINDLSHIGGLRVTSRTSSFVFKDRREDMRAIGRKLGVTSVLEGSVRKAGSRIRVTAQLVNVRDGYHAWSQRYDRELKDVFSIQAEIAKSIADALEIELSDTAQRRVEKSATQNVEAYQFYLRGRRSTHRFFGGNWTNALDMFRRAIELDPDYALAYAGMADVYSLMYLYYSNSDEILVDAMVASKAALELDPDLAEAHSSRALAVSLNRNFEEAEREFDKAIELNPALYETYYYYGRTCHVQGKHHKARELFERAHEVDPDDYQALGLLVQSYHAIGDMEKELETARKTLRILERHVQMEPADSRAWAMGALLYATLDQRERALEWVQRAQSIVGEDSAAIYNFACLYGRLRMMDEALELLARAVDLGWAHREWLDNDPDWDAFREDPRFHDILAKIR